MFTGPPQFIIILRESFEWMSTICKNLMSFAYPFSFHIQLTGWKRSFIYLPLIFNFWIKSWWIIWASLALGLHLTLVWENFQTSLGQISDCICTFSYLSILHELFWGSFMNLKYSYRSIRRETKGHQCLGLTLGDSNLPPFWKRRTERLEKKLVFTEKLTT